MLGVLSKHPEGVEYVTSIGSLYHRLTRSRLMERFHVFTALYHLSELRGRDDLIKGVIQNLDYSA